MSIEDQSVPPNGTSKEAPSIMEPQASFRPATPPIAQTPAGSASQASAKTGGAAPPVAYQARAAAKDAQSAATSFAAEMKDTITEQVGSQAAEQGKMAADKVDQVAEAMHSAAGNFAGKEEWLAGLINQGADELGQLSKMLRTNDLRALLGHIEDFAKRQPSLFAGAALAAGFAAVRVAKASKSQAGPNAGQGSAASALSGFAGTVNNALQSAASTVSDLAAASSQLTNSQSNSGGVPNPANTPNPGTGATFESPTGGATIAGNPPSTPPPAMGTGDKTPGRSL